MWYKDFTGQTQKSTNRGSTVFLIILGLLFGGSAIIRQFSKEKQPPPPPLAAALPLPKSESVRRVDETCASLPKPEQFEFVSKTAPTETDRFVSIAYTFRSSRAASEIYPSFIVWFTQNGWTDNKPVYERLEFSKGNQTVWLAPYHIKEQGDFFTVSCTEWKGVSADD